MKKNIHFFNLVFILVLFLLVINNTGYLQAQWIQSNGPYAGYITSLAKSSTNDIYAATLSGGVYKLLGSGSSWSAVNNGLTTYDIRALLFSGNTLFAGTSTGIFYTANGGTSWTAANNGLTDLQIYTLALNGANIYAGTLYGKLFYTSNGGSTWNDISSNLPAVGITGIYGNGSTSFVGTESSGMFYTSNNGTNWNPIDTGLSTYGKYVNYVLYTGVSGTLFIATHNGIFKTVNSGLTWTSTGISGYNISYLEYDGTNIWASTEGLGVYQSTNGGANWTQKYAGMDNLFTRPFINIGTNLFVGTYGDGIYFSNNAGNYWSHLNTGLYSSSVNALYLKNNVIIAGTYASKIFISNNSGSSWDTSQVAYNSNYTCFADNTATLFCGTSGYGVLTSTNNGTSWTDAVNGGLTNLNVSALVINGTTLFAGTSGSGIFRSTNNGTNFTDVSSTLPANANVKKLSLSGSAIYAALRFAGIYKTTNNGDLWIPVNTGIPISTMNIVYVISAGPLLFACGVGVFVSTNSGAQWIIDTAGLPVANFNVLYAVGNSIYVGTYGSGIYKQTYNGSTWTNWTAFSTGFNARADIRSMIYKSPNLLASVWGQGIWKTPITGIVNTSGILPEKYYLSQNYPNPFNPVTNINFGISISGNVKLNIYDLTGKEITSLVNDILSPGNYKISWDASGLASGVYFYKLQSGEFSEVKKMTLVK